jgi:type IV secretory pathway VirB10-like protein
MKLVHVIGAICLTCACGGWTLAQDSSPPASSSTNPDANPVLKHRPAESPETPKPIIKENIDLAVPKGTALQVVLDREIRVQKVGQPIHGLLIEPVYAFDKLVVPIGTEVTGQISQIESVSAGRRTLAALDANLTPTRKITVEFTELSLAGGKHIPIQTSVVPGSGQVIRFVTASENQKKKGVKDIVTEKERQAKQEARRQFDSAMQQVKEPGKLHRVERYAVAQLPVHPQYIDAGTMYFAELGKPLEFGSEPLTPEIAASMNSEIPEGTMVHARLTTPLNSASTQKGAEVEAVLSRPMVNDGKLILPQGSVLKGSVVQVQPAHFWKHNGQLRFVFRDLVLPNGVESKVQAMVQGVQSGTADNLQLDAEGGAEPKTSKTRYLRSGIAVGLAAATHEDEILNRAEAGAGGFKVVGIVIGATVHSQPLGIAMGAIGAGRSLYNNFIARGTDVVFAKHTAMEIGVDTRGAAPGQNASPASNNNSH